MTYFNPTTVTKRNGGVEKRAGKINPEYQKKAQKADKDWGPGGGWDRDAQGPGPAVEQRLAEFGQVRALIVGPRGEVSKDLAWLITQMAKVGAERKWRIMGARSIPEARAVLKRRFTRMLGNFAIRAGARLKREVLGIALGERRRRTLARRRSASTTTLTRNMAFSMLTARTGAESVEAKGAGIGALCSTV